MELSQQTLSRSWKRSVFFYEKLYKSIRDGLEVHKPNFNFLDLPIPTLSNDSSDLGEGLISKKECKKVLNSFLLNKVPGNDGLPIEFYKTFWDLTGDPLVASFNESFAKGTISPSQRQAVITLIEKKDHDRWDLKNWRPISLLNVDAKTASKVIAERMKRLLPGLIHHNQSGYIPGRNISKKKTFNSGYHGIYES